MLDTFIVKIHNKNRLDFAIEYGLFVQKNGVKVI